MSWLSALGLSLAAAVGARDARACGGCFQGQTSATVVTGHRMVFSISKERTVLWDKIEYAGNPEDFAWVLPVGPGAVLEASDDAWFEALEAFTQKRLASPPANCSPRGGGFGCSSSALNAGGNVKGEDGVTVLHEGSVGPYETVTLKASDPKALTTWLTNHGYALQPDVAPIVDAYVKEGSDFIALRLKPGQGVRSMTPVRVVTPGASPVLPMRMVAAGTGATTSIVLYVIGEGRYKLRDLGNTEIDGSFLLWDWNAQSSNYEALRKVATADKFLTAYAEPTPFSREDSAAGSSITQTYQVGTAQATKLAEVYFDQAAADEGSPAPLCSSALAALNAPEAVVVKQCPKGACSAPNEVDASVYTCEMHDDISAALIGMHPADVWLTRLEANLSRASLAKDLVLVPAAPVEVLASVQVKSGIGDPCGSGGPGGCELASEPKRRATDIVIPGLAALAVAFGARRLRRAPRKPSA